MITNSLLCSILISVASVLSSPHASPNVAALKTYALFSGISYCPRTAIQSFKCNQCQLLGGGNAVEMQALIQPDVNHQAFVAKNNKDKTIVVAIRGTETLANAVTDALVDGIRDADFVRSIPGALVHTGFLRYYLRIRDLVKRNVMALMQANPDYSVVLTGHSLGGAVATLAAFDAAQTYIPPNKIHLYTYGEPRVGNVAFIEAFKSIGFNASFRVTQARDSIPHLPLRDDQLHVIPTVIRARLRKYNYVHKPGELFFSKVGSDSIFDMTTCNDRVQEDPKCALGQWVFQPSENFNYVGKFLRSFQSDHLVYMGVSMAAGSAPGCHPL